VKIRNSDKIVTFPDKFFSYKFQQDFESLTKIKLFSVVQYLEQLLLIEMFVISKNYT